MVVVDPRETTFTVYVYDDGYEQWQELHLTLEEICQKAESNVKCMIALLNTGIYRLPETSPLHQKLIQTFKIPDVFWDDIRQNASGCFWASESPSIHGETESYATFFRFKFPIGRPYIWDRSGFVTRWQPNGSSTVLCFDLSSAVQEQVRASLFQKGCTISTSSPFAMHAYLIEHIVQRLDQCTWIWNSRVRAFETTRTDGNNRRSSYFDMHENAKHVIQSSEMLAMTISVVDSVIEEFESHSSTTRESGLRAIRRAFKFHKSMLRCIQLRSQALEARLRNAINLAFNINAQQDSLVASEIARATQRDGITMKVIGILGMLFLPGTFVSAIFSMSFFHVTGDDEGGSGIWTVSKELWMYWATAVPLTLVTIGSWLAWQQVISRRNKASTHQRWIAEDGQEHKNSGQSMLMD